MGNHHQPHCLNNQQQLYDNYINNIKSYYRTTTN